MKTTLLIKAFLFLFMFFLSLTPTDTEAWTTVSVDAPKLFSNFYSRAVAIDGNGNPHIAYGEDQLYHAYHNGTSWNYETVDVSSGTGQYASLAIDSSDKVHISYYDWSNGNLMYTTNATGSWVTETVDSSGDVGVSTSIAIDASGNVHISYYDWDSGDLKYATDATGSWVAGTVDSVGDVGLYTSIAIDSLGNVHISYNDYDNGDLMYTTNASGSWVDETVDSTGDVGLYTSIAIDASDNVHISYYDYTNGDLKYATDATGSWVTETVDSSGDVGMYSSVAMDSSGSVHVSYYNDSSGDLKYATDATGSWITGTVDSAGDVGLYTSIAIDASDNVHVSYYNNSSGDLKYATDATGSWVDESVDSSSDAGLYTSIAMDASSHIHISYYDDNNGDLKYATNATGSWVTETVESPGTVGKYTSIAIDSLNNVHISYYHNSNGDLKYATNATGSWVTETVDGFGTWVGSYTSIAIDSSDNVHISYYDGINGLKYATNSGVTPGTGNCYDTDWDCEIVDSSGDVGLYTSIAIDSLDNVHISYYDWDSGDLEYATNSGVTPGTGNCTNTDWNCETVDSSGDVGLYTSIAMDSLGDANISYYKLSQLNLKYATNATGSWVDENVDSKNDVGLYTSIAMDSLDNVHISYYDWDSGSLKYATNATGSWVDETVDSSANVGLYTSIEMDSSGNVHISYYDYDNGDLKYTTDALIHTLTVSKAGAGSGTVTSSPLGIDCGTDCSEDYISGTEVTLTPTPDVGSTFAGWSGDPDCSDGVVTMGASKTCSATFDLQSFTLLVNMAGTCTGLVTSSPPGIDCGVDCSGEYSYGTVVTLTATSLAGCRFDSWTGCDSASDNVCTMTMDTNKSVTATFIAQYQLITFISPAAGGSVSPDCSTGCWYDSGTMVILTATANTGYEFDYWTGCDSASDNVCTMTMDTDENVTATFLQCFSPVRITGNPSEYYSLQSAYDAAGDGDTIQSQAESFTEDLYIDRPISVTFEGGYDCTYSTITGNTAVNGDMTISDGVINIENLILQ